MWLEWIFVLSLTLLLQLVVLAVELNDRDVATDALETDWNVTFVVLYVFLALLGVWALLRALYALSLCGGRARPRVVRVKGDEDDNDIDDLLAPDDDFGAPAPSETRAARSEAGVRLGDAAVDLLFAALDLAFVAVLAHTLLARDADELADWTPLFALLFTRLALLQLLLLVGAVQTFALERALAGGSLATAVCGGVLCCCPPTRRAEADVARELDYRDERNTASGVAREARYRKRAQFQDWDCVYVCTPRALPNFAVYLRALLLFLVVPALILSGVLLLARLRALDAAADVLVAPTAAAAAAAVDVPARFRHHDGAPHYWPAFAASGGNWTDVAAHHPSLRWTGDAPSVGVVLAPLFALVGALVLHSTCMCVAYAGGARRRTGAEWTLGALYVVALVALLVSGALLADRIDTVSDVDWHAVFAPLYVAFVINVLIAGSVLLCCVPDPYRLPETRRAIVSRWGLCVYKRK